MSVYKKLNDAREKFHSLALKKTGKNQRYNYFELGDFLIHGLAVFREFGLCPVVTFSAETASMRIIDTDTGEELVIASPMGSASLPNCHEVQNIGAVETYQRRYLWIAALEIVEHDAVDASDGVKKDDEPKAGKPKKDEKPAPKSSHSATDGAYASLNATDQDEASCAAAAMLDAWDKGNEIAAYEVFYESGMSNDVKIAVWELLRPYSKIRSGISKMRMSTSTTEKEAV